MGGNSHSLMVFRLTQLKPVQIAKANLQASRALSRGQGVAFTQGLAGCTPVNEKKGFCIAPFLVKLIFLLDKGQRNRIWVGRRYESYSLRLIPLT